MRLKHSQNVRNDSFFTFAEKEEVHFYIQTPIFLAKVQTDRTRICRRRSARCWSWNRFGCEHETPNLNTENDARVPVWRTNENSAVPEEQRKRKANQQKKKEAQQYEWITICVA